MSYDLNFWKQRPDLRLSPQDVYERLCNGEQVEGLEELPVEDMLAQVKEAFSAGWTRLDTYTWEAPKKSFQVYITSHFFRVDCGGMTGEEMNLLIDIGLRHGCPLYDPQTGVRYEG